MNWNNFNAGWGKILHPKKLLPAGNANIDSLGKNGYAEIPFFKRENPIKPMF